MANHQAGLSQFSTSSIPWHKGNGKNVAGFRGIIVVDPLGRELIESRLRMGNQAGMCRCQRSDCPAGSKKRKRHGEVQDGESSWGRWGISFLTQVPAPAPLVTDICMPAPDQDITCIVPQGTCLRPQTPAASPTQEPERDHPDIRSPPGPSAALPACLTRVCLIHIQVPLNEAWAALRRVSHMLDASNIPQALSLQHHLS